MVIIDKLMDLFCDHAAVVNDDPESLKKEVALLKKKYGPWFRVCGFEDFRQFFLAMHLSEKHPFSVAFIRDTTDPAGEVVLKKVNPTIKTYKYSDTQQLSLLLPSR